MPWHAPLAHDSLTREVSEAFSALDKAKGRGVSMPDRRAALTSLGVSVATAYTAAEWSKRCVRASHTLSQPVALLNLA